MPATLKLFKKASQETWQADAATLPISKPAVVETTAPRPGPVAQAPARAEETHNEACAEKPNCREPFRNAEKDENASTCEAQRYQKDRPILQDNGMEMAPDYNFVRSNN